MMTKSEREVFCIQQLINVLAAARKALPDTLEYAQVAGGDDAELKRHEQCKRLDEALRELELDLEDDRTVFEKMAEKETEDDCEED